MHAALVTWSAQDCHRYLRLVLDSHHLRNDVTCNDGAITRVRFLLFSRFLDHLCILLSVCFYASFLNSSVKSYIFHHVLHLSVIHRLIAWLLSVNHELKWHVIFFKLRHKFLRQLTVGFHFWSGISYISVFSNLSSKAHHFWRLEHKKDEYDLEWGISSDHSGSMVAQFGGDCLIAQQYTLYVCV